MGGGGGGVVQEGGGEKPLNCLRHHEGWGDMTTSALEKLEGGKNKGKSLEKSPN